MLNPFVQNFLAKNKKWKKMRPKIPALLAEQYAQSGEDLIVESLLFRLIYFHTLNHKNSFSLEGVTYLEIGANHPVSTSSTYLFYKKGARGILVEPNPELAKMLRSTRPSDRVLGVACVDDDSTNVTLHVSEASELSSMIMASPMRWSRQFKIDDSILVPAININDLAELFWTEFAKDNHTFLSIDCEGMDLRIVSKLDLQKFPFDIIQIEPGEPLVPKNLQAIEASICSRGYALMALTEVNAIFVNKSKFKID